MASAAKPAPKPPYTKPPRDMSSMAAIGADEDTADDNRRLSLNHVEGRLKAKSVKKVGDLVESHPVETITILRGWLHDDH